MTTTLLGVQEGVGIDRGDTGIGLRVARGMLWLASFLPFIYLTQKNASDLSGGGGVGGLEALRGAGPFALWGLSLLVAPVRRRGWGAPEAFLGAYAFVILASALIPLNPSPQGTVLKSISMIAVLLAMARLVRLYDHPRDLVIACVGLVHLVLLAGAVQIVLFKSTVYAVDENSIDGLARLNIVLPSISANPLAFVGVAGILSCAVGVAPRWLHFSVPVRYALMALYVYEIFLTRTRSALLVGLVIVAFTLILRARRHLLSSVATAVVFLAAALVMTPSLMPELHSFLQRGQTAQGIDTLSGRTVIWHMASQVWHQNQVFGLGYYSGHRLGIPGLQQDQSNIDNTWLETLVDVGLLGLVPLALFTLVGVWRLWRCKELEGDARLWALGTALFIVAISFINPTVQAPGMPQVVMTLLILATAPSRPVDREPEAAPPGIDRSRTPSYAGPDPDRPWRNPPVPALGPQRDV